LAANEFNERRFADAVAAEETYTLAMLDLKGKVFEQRVPAIANANILHS
jgi:hypothetical protein